MNLDKEEERKIASLRVGEAAVHSAGDDRALLVKVPYVKIPSELMKKEEEDQKLKKAMKAFHQRFREVFLPFKACSAYCNDVCRFHKLAQRVVEDPKFEEVFSMYVLSGVINWKAIFVGYPLIQQSIEERKKGLDLDVGFTKCVIIQAADRYFEKRGQQYGWKYEDVEEMKDSFIKILQTIASAYPQSDIEEGERETIAKEIKTLQKKYKELSRRQYDPFFGCEETCTDGLCLYRYGVEPLLYDENLSRQFSGTISRFKGNEMWERLGRVCQIAARRVVSEAAGPEAKRRASICFAIQKSFTNPYFDAFLREKIVTNILRVFHKE